MDDTLALASAALVLAVLLAFVALFWRIDAMHEDLKNAVESLKDK